MMYVDDGWLDYVQPCMISNHVISGNMIWYGMVRYGMARYWMVLDGIGLCMNE